MNIDHITPSILKVTASENLNIEEDLKKAESSKTLEQLLNEEEKISEEKSQTNS